LSRGEITVGRISEQVQANLDLVPRKVGAVRTPCDGALTLWAFLHHVSLPFERAHVFLSFLGGKLKRNLELDRHAPFVTAPTQNLPGKLGVSERKRHIIVLEIDGSSVPARRTHRLQDNSGKIEALDSKLGTGLDLALDSVSHS
jgi:hypothetical protein